MSIIVDMLLNSNDNEKDIISIVGMPGQGKTTLAKMVYHNHKVISHFDHKIWICVSDDFDVTNILNEMVQSVTKTDSLRTNIEAIIKRLQDNLKGKRYLLVLDDVWNENPGKWESTRVCLQEIDASRGSKIMVTTRSDTVASAMQTSFPYHLERLSDEDSWTLFKERAFAGDAAIETDILEGIGREIVEKCGGLPLAINAAGGLLSSKKSEREWRQILDALEEHVGGEVGLTLKLSYDHLEPIYLKQCFVSCSIFPKDFDFKKDNLIQLWMALGLLHPPNENSVAMEDIGDSYVNTLLWNSLLQDAKKDEYENITSCKMHDLVHDLAQRISENFCATLEASEVNGVNEVVHLSLISTTTSRTPKIANGTFPRLKTLILKDGLDGKLLTNFKCLQVLVLDNYHIRELPRSIGKLKHLRYLDVSKTCIHMLPDNITKLYNLQTLIVDYLGEIPNKFRNLVNLRHFCVKRILWCRYCTIIGVGQMTCLRTLPLFVVSGVRGCQIEELGNLNNLTGELNIYGLEDVENEEEAKNAKLSSKSNIHSLGFYWPWNRSSRSEGYNDGHVLEGLTPHSNLKALTIKNFKGGNFASWMMERRSLQVLESLVTITLEKCNGCEQIPTLGHLPHLKVVEIDGMDNVKRIGSEFYATGNSAGTVTKLFPSLRELTLRNMAKLEEWLAPTTTIVFPYLEKLEIEWCKSLVSVPSHFPSIKELRILGINNSVALKEMSTRLTSLTSLFLAYVNGSEFQLVVEELLGNNTCLKNLEIQSCDELLYLPDLEALERLYIRRCNKLRDVVCCLPSLRELTIDGCEKLSGLPESCRLIEELDIRNCPNLKYICPDIRCFPSLRRLKIYDCEKLTSLPQLCMSLEDLTIGKCRAMVSLPDLRYLRKLNVWGLSEELDYFPWPSDDDTQHLQLQILDIGGWPKIRSLPDQLRHLSALTDLCLHEFDGLEALPDWLGDLSSLQTLSVTNCQNLMYMPSLEAMGRLATLSKLDIFNSPLLIERCIKGTRPEWKKIAHIPKIYI